MTAYGDILWQPSVERQRASAMHAFATFAHHHHGAPEAGVGQSAEEAFRRLHTWSLAQPENFWDALLQFCGVKFLTRPTSVYEPPPSGRMRGARWLVGGRLNYAHNLLEPEGVAPDDVAVIARAEGSDRRSYRRQELKDEVARVAAALRQAGVQRGDVVAGVVANIPEALIAMLATSSLGAVWSSCSPDFGVGAVVDRLGQVRPKVVFYTEAYLYNGKYCDVRPTLRAALERLPSVQRSVAIAHLRHEAEKAPDTAVPGSISWREFVGEGAPPPLSYEPLPADAPLFILFSSGTTGVPKCITHGVGGTLLQHVKELRLHSDIGPGGRLLYYTTCGWMMWNWMVSALGVGASLVLYEGAVTQPDAGELWRVTRAEEVTALGTSPKFISLCMNQRLDVAPLLQGAPLRTVLSTGSPLLPEHGTWVYAQMSDVHLASISGGTDIIGCFMLGTPVLPVRAGEIQYAGLGMAIDAWDEAGEPVRGTKGELVCTRPFPSMPVGFWGDHDGQKYQKAYFNHYQHLGREVWRHGDFIEITPHGGVVVYGRSDATLNPGGVRIGTAELYRQVESLAEVEDAIAVGRREADDTPIVLFVKLTQGLALDASLEQRIRGVIRANLTPRHLPKWIIAVRDIPYTRSGKKVELAVTQAIHGEPVSNLAVLANPESMTEYIELGRQWAAPGPAT